MIAALKQLEAGRKAEDVAREVGVRVEARGGRAKKVRFGYALGNEKPLPIRGT
jgi:hypothetical protein